MEPLIKVILIALKERGWTANGGLLIDPEGNTYKRLDRAIAAQSFREITAMGETRRRESEEED
jgi:hypothetical protein